MSQRADLWIRLWMPLLLFASAVAVVAAVSTGAARLKSALKAVPDRDTAVVLIGADEPIVAEADVFRTSAALLAVDPAARGRRPAHPRTLATYRSLRAYPGAPPRIPHGLTPEETHTGGCNTCHERGGYSQRFGAYVPVNPHPDKVACLQCHVGDDKLLAVPLPGMDPSARCRQCHTPDAARWSDSAIVWKAMAWPRLAAATPDRPPPPIPHGRALRGNCLACHAAPSAVAEITTRHPERSNCRQCHVEAGGS